MSLFPAYAEASASKTTETTDDSSTWLENSSFQIDLNQINLPPENEKAPPPPPPTVVTTEKSRSKKRKPKEHKHKHKEKRSKEDLEKDGYMIDKRRIKEYLTVKTISRPAVPKYISKYRMVNLRFRFRKRRFKRYYQMMLKRDNGKDNSGDEAPTITKKNLNTLEGSKSDENFVGFKQEEELKHQTAVFNRNLGENPHDVQLWLGYVNFQDTVYQFEKTYRKGSIAKGLRVMAERKLSILDKALMHNPNCEELLRKRLNVAVSVYPADELQVQLKILIDKDQGNIILWQGYIESIQCSMSHCNTPAVMNLYSKCLAILHKLRRSATMERIQLEENILKMLNQCGLFLKQTGLFEQLWTLLRLYLELNLSPSDKNKFNITSGFREKQLIDLEEIVFKSQLPLHELWLRTEKLRESCHWLPYTAEGDCEDPQRLVFPEDVAELIHPITVPENTFKLTATILTLLKIPLLPCRHVTMQDLGLDYVPWSLDSIESLLPIFLPLHPINLVNRYLIIDSRLAVGPQYLNVLPGQEEYLEFILATMKNCADCLSGNDKLATTIWWLRFQKLLIILDKEKRFKIPQGFLKKIKSNIKNLLKQDENRNNVLYYCEYAQIEYELGNLESCLNILRTALNFGDNKISICPDERQIARCYLYRTLVEIYLNEPNQAKETALKYLITFALEKSDVIKIINEDIINEATLKFKHITLQLLKKDRVYKLPVVEQFLPNFLTDWLICNGWFLYLTKGAINCGTFIEEILSEWEENHFYKEVLFEFYVSVMFKFCIAKPGFGIFKVLDDVLTRAIEKFPNNLFLLSVLAKEQCISSNSGYPWWKVKSLLIKSGRAFPTLFLVILANQQIVHMQEMLIETVTGNKYEISDSLKNRMLSLFRRITRADMCTRRCGLVWRLYLQFVHSHFSPTLCRNVYYCAVEECPWLKALYIDAAIYIPAELAQIQDLIIEKQLRIHVTPEELDVLRS